MHRGRRLGLVGWLAIAVAMMLAGCSRVSLQQSDAPPLGILSVGHISFSSLSFNALNNVGYTNVAPSVTVTAKGLGGGTSTSWSSDLTANWDLVYQCVNNGTNIPQGTINYGLYNAVLAYQQINQGTISKNGKATFGIDTPSDYLQTTWAELTTGTDPVLTTAVCPNSNYSIQPLGYRWNSVTINLMETDNSGTTTTDHITYTCSDPADPSSQTCTIQ